VVTGILINLFVFLAPAFPLLIYGWYVAWKRAQYYKLEIPRANMPDLDKYFIYAEIGGTLLLLILLATYISRVYRKWYSLPED
jgi:hypothetical protein